MTPAPIHIAGERLMLDPAGVLVWPARKLLVVADLHLEKGSAFAATGRLLPPYDSRETLQRLALALRRWRPARIVALGDSFHDAAGAARLPPAEATALARMLGGAELVWVLGNHDPVAPDGLPGAAVEELAEPPFVFRHEARPGRIPPGEISGHFHPKATMPTRCGGVTRPCFLADAWRVMLPAFGAYTGGLSVTDPALAGLFPRGARAFLLGQERLFSLPLAPSRARVA
ncbi:ligase-associated DNA damage response endonuclease PdeM [Siccirubricoccus sp. KC 17139]|uniref:Ligase-associated DNA damage response endonuclease PdeM n=1 Tax=Siccirubricoccus soli TaxID=2899147 RepID=A0ABT1DCS8_9PROT|nr:ligase-associated DNA damage response endonuclease PdeM [Siccirubricoccus soli]MCO6419742.1 ligase-associated DNA damage response endonuclease PdeM [Siccirubricoccus soli]MCP2685877.1 ligase-associated DNA damage response endonuclease PdeM [Siccirubricoccus soli]